MEEVNTIASRRPWRAHRFKLMARVCMDTSSTRSLHAADFIELVGADSRHRQQKHGQQGERPRLYDRSHPANLAAKIAVDGRSWSSWSEASRSR